MTISLERLHKEQLEIALEIKNICEKNKIPYSIIAGTLLGAVRHGGFIPWDDDLDIGMLRENYNRFISIANQELRQEYFLQTWDTDSNFALPYAKVRKNNTKLVEKQSASVKLHQGIFVDVFPFDNVPKNQTKKIFHKWLIWILIHVFLAKQGYGLGEKGLDLKKFLYKITNIFAKPVSISTLKFVLMKQMTKYNKHDAEEIVCLGGSYGYSKETVKKRWFENLTTMNFQGHEMTALKDYEEYLSDLYGDYMVLPPKNKRIDRHGIIEISIEGPSINHDQEKCND